MEQDEESLEERLRSLKKEIPTDPKKAKELSALYYSLAQSYNQIGKTEQQIECFERSLELNPENIYTLSFLGEAYEKKGEYDKAIELFNKILKLDPEDICAYSSLAITYQKKGMAEEAEKYQKIYEEIRKKQAEANIKKLEEEIRKKENEQ